MTARSQSRSQTFWLLLLVVAFLRFLAPSLMQAQSPSCAGQEAIYYSADNGSDGIDIEQTVCLYYDPVSGVDATVETDDDAYEDWNDAFILDVFGVGSEAQVYGLQSGTFSYDPSSSGAPLIADSGMRQSGTSGTGGGTSYAETPAPPGYATYGLVGVADLCYNWNANYATSGCYWQNYYYGLWTQLQVGTPQTPLITSLSPALGVGGMLATIGGQNYGTQTGSVTFNGTPATIVSWTATKVVAAVPASASTGPVVLTTAVGFNSNGVTFQTPVTTSCR